MPTLKRLRRIARSVRNRFVPRAIIFLYHRVIDLRSDPQLLCVHPQHFAQHLQVIRNLCSPMKLEQLPNAPRRSCGAIVTFDDGYADNLQNAKPLLQRHEIPATVFVATGYIESRREFWKDYLERIFLQPGTLPAILRLPINGDLFQYDLDSSAKYTVEDYQLYCRWNVGSKNDPTARQRVYRALCGFLRPLAEGQRWEVIKELLAWAGVESQPRASHETLSAQEVRELSEGGLIEIGAHTVTHPVLAGLPTALQRDEILGSKVSLEKILGHSVSNFAYPYGGSRHYTGETVTAVRQAGFERACSNFEGLVGKGTDMWQLPRFLVRDWPGEEFASRLKAWLARF